MIYIKELPSQRRERIAIRALSTQGQKTLAEAIDQNRIAKKRR